MFQIDEVTRLPPWEDKAGDIFVRWGAPYAQKKYVWPLGLAERDEELYCFVIIDGMQYFVASGFPKRVSLRANDTWLIEIKGTPDSVFLELIYAIPKEKKHTLRLVSQDELIRAAVRREHRIKEGATVETRDIELVGGVHVAV